MSAFAPVSGEVMDWKKYEKAIFEHFRSEFPAAKITRDARVLGRYSKVERQIDVLIEDNVAGFEIRIAIDAKHHNRRLDVTEVEAFLGYCSDVGANKGVMISLHGFSPAALNRAHYDDSDIELDVLNFAELKQLQGFGAIPYAGGYGVLLPAPFGWVVDATRREGMVATLYQRGHDLAQAQRGNEWMYVNFWDKTKKNSASTLEELLAHQESYIRADDPDAEFKYQDGPKRNDAVTKIRRFASARRPTQEYTGFIEFDEFIFFCVMFSPTEVEKRNVRKLNYILRTVLPIRIRHDEEDLLETLKLRPWDKRAFILLIDQYRREKRFDAYKNAVREYIALDYGNTYTFSVYVDFLSRENMLEPDREIARELSEQEFSNNEEIGAVFYNLGHMAEMDGDRQLAFNHFTKSLNALKQLTDPPPGSIAALTQLIARAQERDTKQKDS
jgi:hypothetical protein